MAVVLILHINISSIFYHTLFDENIHIGCQSIAGYHAFTLSHLGAIYLSQFEYSHAIWRLEKLQIHEVRT